MALLVLRVTDKCNLKCRYCYAYRENGADMDFSVAKKSIDEFYNHYLKFKIQITGGEPLLNYDLIIKIAEYIKSLGIEAPINIQTNGTLLNRERLENLQKYNIGISISLDGIMQINDNLRPLKNGESSFRITDANITKMAEMGIYTQLNAVVTKENVDYIDKLFDYALVKGNIRGISIDILRNISKGKNVESADKEQLIQLLKRIEIKLELFRSAGIQIEFKDFSKMVYILSNNIERNHYCYAQTYSSIAVMPNGDYYPCSSLAEGEEFFIANINEGIGEIKVFRQLMTNSNKCNKCDIKNLCCGGCSAGRIYGNSDLDCIIKTYSYEYAKKMLKNKELK